MSNSPAVAPYEEDDLDELLEADDAEEPDEGDDDADDGDEAAAAPAPKSRPKLKTKGKKPVGRKSALTDEFWEELKALYEGAGYSQRDVVNYARTRGVVISQAAICRRATDHGWVKGSKKAEIREAVFDEIREQVGEGFRKMLEQHANQSLTLEMEILQHFRSAQETRKVDPDYKIPAVTLNQLGATLRGAQEMRARAMGFNYREGRPFKVEDENEEGLTELKVRVLSDDEHSDLKKKGEEPDQES